jgi:hypothetical protein
MNTEQVQIGWRFWLWWVLASTAGFAVGSIVIFVGSFVGAMAGWMGRTGAIPGWMVGGVVVAGAAIGIAQWLVLQQQVSQSGRWILASTVGFTVGFIVPAAMYIFDAYSVGRAVSGVVFGAVLGASIGIAQWFALRRHVSRAGWWVLASTVGSAVGGAFLAALVLDLIGTVSLVLGLAMLVLSLVPYGAITGGAMVWLLRQPIIEKSSPPQGAA